MTPLSQNGGTLLTLRALLFFFGFSCLFIFFSGTLGLNLLRLIRFYGLGCILSFDWVLSRAAGASPLPQLERILSL